MSGVILNIPVCTLTVGKVDLMVYSYRWYLYTGAPFVLHDGSGKVMPCCQSGSLIHSRRIGQISG